MIAVDVSRWSVQGSVISRDVWRTLKRDHQVELAIVGAWHGASPNPGCRASLENARNEGLHIQTYTVLTLGGAARPMAQALDIVGEPLWKELGRCWLDCELDGITVPIIREAFNILDGWGTPSGIYTAQWWWHGRFGNPTMFRERPLWNAVYDHDPDVDFPKYPYGGWTLDQLHGEQYTGSSYVAGIFVDWNFFYDDKVTGGTAMDHAEIERRLVKNENAIRRAGQLRQAAGIWSALEALAHRDEPPSQRLRNEAEFVLGGL